MLVFEGQSIAQRESEGTNIITDLQLPKNKFHIYISTIKQLQTLIGVKCSWSELNWLHLQWTHNISRQ